MDDQFVQIKRQFRRVVAMEWFLDENMMVAISASSLSNNNEQTPNISPINTFSEGSATRNYISTILVEKHKRLCAPTSVASNSYQNKLLNLFFPQTIGEEQVQ